MKSPLLALLLAMPSYATLAQQDKPASRPNPASAQEIKPPAADDKRAEAYYYYALGHFNEQQYEATSQSEFATQAIENFKKAYELDPRAAIIGERLAEMYAKSFRIRDAVVEAQAILKRDPENLPARRLLARIYLRTLGDQTATASQREMATRAIEQYREIRRMDPADTEAGVLLGRLYRLQGDHARAEEAWRSVLTAEPANQQATEQLAQLLVDTSRAAEAVALLEPLAQRTPSARVLSLLGAAYAQTQQQGKSEAAYRRAAELDARDPGHLRGLARALTAQQKYEQAVKQYERLIQLEPDDAENYLRAAQLYRHLRQLDRAQEKIAQAKERAPGNLEVVFQEALLDQAQGRTDAAILALNNAVAALKARPGRLEDSRRALGILYEQLGRLYRDDENYPQALHTYQEMQKLGGDTEAQARAMVIDTLRASRDLTAALTESEKALAANPGDRSAQMTHAILLGEKGATAEAARRLRTLLNGSPAEDREIQISLAQVYERGRQYADAENSARAALALAASPAEKEIAHLMLGAIYERQERLDAAEEQFRQALAINPQSAQALNSFGYMLADRGRRLPEAVEMIRRALVEDPLNGAYLDSLGWAFFKQGKLADAEEQLRKAVSRLRYDPTIREHLGDVLYQLGRNEQAAAEWEKALTEWRHTLPGDYEADKVAALEKRLNGLKHRLAQKGAPDLKPK